jgi:4,5-DOPA dioxygenase extradiol
MLKQIGVMPGQAQKAAVTKSESKMSRRMPALFIGHGDPMNALLANPYTQRWAAIGATLPRPKAILSVSTHWHIADAAVTVSTAPRTIHDFGGFPHELY